MSTKTQSPSAPAVQPHEDLFGYEVIALFGRGAGSPIYAVMDRATKQVYAIKHVVRATDRDDRFVEQLENEFEVSQRFSHPGLRRALDLKVNKTLFRKTVDAALVLEMFDGVPLETRLPRKLSRVVRAFVGAGEALQALHEYGYVHCDLKPNNILLDPHGAVKVIDFGQACPAGTAKKRIQGTPDFIAPEQVKCEPVTVATDVFNFGATLYWALSGKKLPTLFNLRKGSNSFLVDSVMQSPREINAEVPENLSNLVMECVRTQPNKRPADMGEVTRRLEIIHHPIKVAAKRERQQALAV